MDTTFDGLLNRRVVLGQPVQGYRIAVDTVFLAAAIPAQPGDKILDLGCGVGGAMLCLGARVASIAVTGIEIQEELAELCRRNIERNNFHDRMDVLCADATKFTGGPFDHVLMNAPYHDETRHDVSAHAGKRTANTEKEGDLDLWIGTAARALKPSGMLTLIHRADRRDEILGLLEKSFGAAEILPVLPKPHAPAKRVILRARKDDKTRPHFCRSLILHKAQGGYTDEAEEILRHAKPLKFTLI